MRQLLFQKTRLITRNVLKWLHIVAQRLSMKRAIGKWKKENE